MTPESKINGFRGGMLGCPNGYRGGMKGAETGILTAFNGFRGGSVLKDIFSKGPGSVFTKEWINPWGGGRLGGLAISERLIGARRAGGKQISRWVQGEAGKSATSPLAKISAAKNSAGHERRDA